MVATLLSCRCHMRVVDHEDRGTLLPTVALGAANARCGFLLFSFSQTFRGAINLSFNKQLPTFSGRKICCHTVFSNTK